MAWIPIAIGAVGGLLSSSQGSSGSGQTTQNLLDPRMASYLYGDNGLINGANSLFQQQFAQGGLNPLQTAGLEMQRQALMDPQYTQGYGAMRSLGLGMMGQGVAGNPFTQAPQAVPQAQQQPMMQAGGPGGLVQQGRTALGFSPLGGMVGPTPQPLMGAYAPITASAPPRVRSPLTGTMQTPNPFMSILPIGMNDGSSGAQS